MRQLVITGLILFGALSIGCEKEPNRNKHTKSIQSVAAYTQKADSLLADMKKNKDSTARVMASGVTIMHLYASWIQSDRSEALLRLMSDCSPRKLRLINELEKVSRKAMSQAANLPSGKSNQKVKELIEGADGFVTILKQFTSQQKICRPINEMKKDGGSHFI
jgi:hypothetical protein